MPVNLTIKQRWQALPPKRRMIVAAGLGCGVLFLVALMMAPAQPLPPTSARAKPATLTNLGLPGAGDHDLTIEKLSATVEAVQKDIKQTQATIQHENEVEKAKLLGAQSHQPDTVRELQAMREEIAKLKADSNKPLTLDDALPVGDIAPVLPMADSAPVDDNEPKLRVLVGDAKGRSQEEEATPKPTPTVYLPAGSNFEGVLLNGMDAPTSGVAQKNPVPALIRLKTDAILPNRYRYDVRECFAIVSGYGTLNSERVMLQTVVMSCTKTDGLVIEAKIEGYVVGEDGRVGLRGKPISRQGSLLAKSFLSGFISGVGQQMTPLSVPQLNTSPGTTAQYQTPNLSSVVTSGTAQGISQSARMLSQFYMDAAREMVPIIEIGSNRRATIILLKGVELKMSGEKSL